MNTINIELVIKSDTKKIKKNLGDWTVIIHDHLSKKLVIEEAFDLISKGINNSINSELIEQMIIEICQEEGIEK